MKRRRNQVGESLPNVRIARRRRGMPPEVLGGWIVRQEEFPTSTKMNYIRKQLKEAQEEEPRSGWQLEMRGSERDWHPVEENPFGSTEPSAITYRLPGEWTSLLRSSIRHQDDPEQEQYESSLLRRIQQMERDLVAVGSGSKGKRARAKSKYLGLMDEAEKWWASKRSPVGNPFDLKSLSRLIGTKPLKVKLQKVAGQIQMRIEKPTKELLRRLGGNKTMRSNERTWGTYGTKAEADRAVRSFSSGDRAAQIRKSYGIAPETLRVVKTGGTYRVVGARL